jgi:hypothetical protein
MVFNDLVCPSPQPRQAIDEAIAGFAALVRHVVQLRSDAALAPGLKLEDLELAPGYYMAEWIGQPGHRDIWRRIRGVQQHTPFSELLPPDAECEDDYMWSGRSTEAFRVAHLLGGLMVSLLLDECWDISWLHGERVFLVADSDSELDREAVSVRHSATLENTAEHEPWMKTYGLHDLKQGAEVWAARETLFPHLQFLPRAEKDLQNLTWEWVQPVANLLQRLDDATAHWDPQRQALPPWQTKVTNEDETRKRLCYFADIDGQKRLFDLHARFTPGKGRLHLRLVPEERAIRIAYIGSKIDPQ